MDETADQRRAIIQKYARLRNDRPVFCAPRVREIEQRSNGRRHGKDGKVIYPDRMSAQMAALEFERVTGAKLEAYECPRSKHGHCHLKGVRPSVL